MTAKFLLALLLTLPAFSWAQSSYVVRKGDTLLSIADKSLGISDKNDPRRYEFVRRLRALNPDLKNPNVLEPGQELTLPGGALSATAKKTPAPLPTPTPIETAVPAEEIASAPVPDASASQHNEPAEEIAASEPASAAAHSSPVVPPPAEAHAQPQSQANTQAKHEEAHHEGGHSDFFFIQPRYQVVTLTVKDLVLRTEAKMKSQTSFGLDLQYGKILNKDFHLLFNAGVTQTQFKDIEGGLSTVNHKKETLKTFAIGLAYEATSTLHLDLMAMYADRTFLLPAGVANYELKALMIPGAELNISWDFWSEGSNIFGISAIGEYVGELKKDGVEYKSALEPLGALYMKSNNGPDSLNYKVTVTYKHGHQKTNISEQYEDLGILGVGFYF